MAGRAYARPNFKTAGRARPRSQVPIRPSKVLKSAHITIRCDPPEPCMLDLLD